MVYYNNGKFVKAVVQLRNQAVKLEEQRAGGGGLSKCWASMPNLLSVIVMKRKMEMSLRGMSEANDVAIAKSLNKKMSLRTERSGVSQSHYDEITTSNAESLHRFAVPLPLTREAMHSPRNDNKTCHCEEHKQSTPTIPVGKNVTNHSTFQPFKHSTRKSAFTLAEVLIALGIVGVVAALTLPTVINNIQGRQLHSALKKSYSTISQALDMYYADNGEKYVISDQAGALKNVLIKYIKNVRDCGMGHEVNACVSYSKNGILQFKDVYKNFNGTESMLYSKFDDGQFVINDGSLVMIENESANKYNYISIDVNGYNKKPNRLGQDVFMFQIMSDGKLLPMGTEGTYYYNKNTYCSLTSSNNMNGAGCTIKALTEKDFFKNLPK